MLLPSLPQLLSLLSYGACLCYVAILSLFFLAAAVLLLYLVLETIIYGCSTQSRALSTKGGLEQSQHLSKLPSAASLSSIKSLLRQEAFNYSSPCIQFFNRPGRLELQEVPHERRKLASHTPIHDPDIDAKPPDVFVPGPLIRVDLSGQPDLPIPTIVPCRLVINLDRSGTLTRPYTHHRYFYVQWQEAASFEHCVKTAETFLEGELERGHAFFMSSSHYRIVKQSTLDDSDSWLAHRRAQERRLGDHSDEIELYSESVKNRGTWQWSLPRMLSQQMNAEPDSILFLELSLSYTQYTPHPTATCNGHDCLSVIRDTLFQERIELAKSDLNCVKDAWFVSAKLINNFFTMDLIQHLVDHDTQLKQETQWLQKSEQYRQNFAKQVHKNCIRLLACSIMAKLNLICVFRLVENKKEDVDIPLAKQDLQRLPSLVSNRMRPVDLESAFQEFIRFQGSFKAHSFQSQQESGDDFFCDNQYRPPRKHEDIDPNTVIPIVESEFVKSGAHADVYRVRLHSDHHDFSPDRNKEFAVKYVVRKRKGEDLTHESRILTELAEVPHPHITPLLASWSQPDSCSILLPLAKEPLSSMMTTAPGPELRGCFVIWFLRQMEGLASALDHIHNLGPSKCGSERLPKDGNRSKSGVHHDLHPGNILVFPNDILKISDFGTARIQQVLGSGKGSHESHDVQCHSGYEAPQNALDHTASRPHDVWALGCIFLEMLVWASGHSVQDFVEFRKSSMGTTELVHDEAFWYKDCDGRRRLKPVVRGMIGELQRQHKDRHLFQELLRMVEGMLRIETKPIQPIETKPFSTQPDFRYTIQKVLIILKNMKSQADMDLNEFGEDYFMSAIPEQSGGKFVLPSEVMSSEDIGDNDNYPHEEQFDNLLHVPRVPLGRRKTTGGEFMNSDQLSRLFKATSIRSLSIQTSMSNYQSDLAQAGAHTGDAYHAATPGTPSIRFTDHDQGQGTPSSQARTEACLYEQCAYNPSMPCSHPKTDAQQKLKELGDILKINLD